MNYWQETTFIILKDSLNCNIKLVYINMFHFVTAVTVAAVTERKSIL